MTHSVNSTEPNTTEPNTKITIGSMEYINIFPLYYYLKDNPRLEFVKGTPQKLNSMLDNGEISCAFASAVTYLNSPERYDILPFCIGSYQKVESVTLFSQEPIEFLHDKSIYLTGESATSSLLLKLIIKKFIGIQPNYTTNVENRNSSVAQLLIGDSALARYHNDRAPYTYDISELWNLLTGHSSVFGLLLVTKNTPVEVKKYLHQALTTAYDQHLNDLDLCYDSLDEKDKFLPKSTIVNYWKLLEYQLNPVMLSSLLGMFAMIESNILQHLDASQTAYTLTGAVCKGSQLQPPQQFEKEDDSKPSPKLSLIDEHGETYTI